VTPEVRAAVDAVLEALDEEAPEKVTVEFYARGVAPLVQVMFAPALVTMSAASALVVRLGGDVTSAWGLTEGWVEGNVGRAGVTVRVRVEWRETGA
jgi:hypothetical protein